VVEDGSPSTLIAMNAVIASNNVMLQGMIISLTNVIHHGEEYLNVTGMNTEPNITLVLVRYLVYSLFM